MLKYQNETAVANATRQSVFYSVLTRAKTYLAPHY